MVWENQQNFPVWVDDSEETIFTNLNDSEFIQIRITFFLHDNVGPLDEGPYLDDWAIRFTYDQ